MTFPDAIKRCLNNYANFSGRARRSEFWYFYLFACLVSAFCNSIAVHVYLLRFVAGLVNLALVVPVLAVFWRRLHDIGKSGLYFFLIAIPLVGQILMLIWCLRDSQPGTNQYGVSEKYDGFFCY